MAENSIRLDKWLWFARVVKTRTLAQKLVRSSKVRVDKVKATNPARQVSAGETLTITLERQIKVLKIVECGDRRGPFAQACKLYQDLSPPPPAKDVKNSLSEYEILEKTPRPDKQNRRKLVELKNRQYFQ